MMRYVAAFVLMLGLCASTVQAESLMMATTTSTQDSGLLEYLLPIFEKDTGHQLKWIATGTGKALEHGKACDVDVLLVHAPTAEKKYVEEGYGIMRHEVMYNDFILLGPAKDPAKIRGKSIADAMKQIADTKALFISRGDKSGTHQAELELWKKADITPPEKDSWYLSVGQGMGATLNIAAEKEAYVLADRGTYIKMQASWAGKEPLIILVEGDANLFNQYSVMMVNPERCEAVAKKKAAAEDFIQWWLRDATQKAIADYRFEGKQLFFSNAKK